MDGYNDEIDNKIIQMLKNSARLMHISSDQEDEEIIEKNKTQAIRMSSHKLQGGMITKSLFGNIEDDQQGYIIQDINISNVKTKKPIKYIGTVHHKRKNKIQKQEKSIVHEQKSEEEYEECISLSTIEKMKVQEEEESHQTEQNLIRMTAPCRRTVLNIDLNDESDSQSVQNIEVQINSDGEDNEKKQKQKEGEEKDEDNDQNPEDDDSEQEKTQQEQLIQIKSSQIDQMPFDISGIDSQTKIIDYKKKLFIKQKIKPNYQLRTLIQRLDSGVNYFLPQFDCNFMDDFGHILSAKKQFGTKFQYVISSQRNDISDSDRRSIGKVIANFSNSIFNVFQYTDIENQLKLVSTTRFIDDKTSKIVSPKCYEIYLLKDNVDYWSLNGVGNRKSDPKDLAQLFPMNMDNIIIYHNKKPQYLEQCKSYTLNFSGRVAKGSVKNFIIEDENTGKEILMFGKGNADFFNAYISHPITPFLAMAWILPYFSSRIIVK